MRIANKKPKNGSVPVPSSQAGSNAIEKELIAKDDTNILLDRRGGRTVSNIPPYSLF